jgi:hypothetical protein
MWIDTIGDDTMSKQIKLLMETFNKFLNEEESSFDNKAFKQDLESKAKDAQKSGNKLKRKVNLNDKFHIEVEAMLGGDNVRYTVTRYTKQPDGKTRMSKGIVSDPGGKKVTSQEEASELMDFMTKSSEELQSYLP